MGTTKISARINNNLHKKLENHSTISGYSKSRIIADAIEEYITNISSIPVNDRITALESKVEKLIKKFGPLD